MIKLIDLKDGYYVQNAFVVMVFLSYPCCQTSGEFLTWVKGVGEGEAVEDKHLGSKLAGGGEGGGFQRRLLMLKLLRFGALGPSLSSSSGSSRSLSRNGIDFVKDDGGDTASW